LPKQDDTEGFGFIRTSCFHLAIYDKEKSKEYKLKRAGNDVYFFVLESKTKNRQSGFGKAEDLEISEIDSFKLEALESSKILLIEVPMELPEPIKEMKLI